MGAMFIEHQRTASSLPPQTVFEPDKWFSVYTASQERERFDLKSHEINNQWSREIEAQTQD